MIGVTWAFFHQGVFGRRIGKVIILYLVGVSLWYAGINFLENSGPKSAQTNKNSSSDIKKGDTKTIESNSKNSKNNNNSLELKKSDSSNSFPDDMRPESTKSYEASNSEDKNN
jgi:cytoskeletal protein RodZ